MIALPKGLPEGDGRARPLLDREGLIWTLIVAHGSKYEEYEGVSDSGLEAAADLVMDEDAELGRALSVLKGVEWGGSADAWEGGIVPCCPRCGAEETDGHLDGCTLAEALARVKE